MVVDAAKTAFVCRYQHVAADGDGTALANGRHDNHDAANDAACTTSSIPTASSTNHSSLTDSSDVPLTDRPFTA